MYRQIIICLLLLVISNSGFSQIERPDKAKGELKVNVIQSSDSAVYIFKYNIKNSETSEQVLASFSIALKDGSFYTKTVDSPENKKWYVDGLNKGFITGSAASKFIELPPENGLKPGESISISFSSEGLPAIHDFYTRGFAPPITFELLDTLYAQGYTDEEIFLDWKEESYKGITISPKEWPEDFDTSTFIDSLDSYQHRSCEELGWITNQGICNSLQVKLRNVRRHLERDKPKQARNVLHAFINQVEAQRGKHITEEGYALLYFNAEYLLDKLDSGGGY
ncbi:FIMAH domain-containing protein [Gracilimonas sediminicola]|uniref:FIMAH domain-containing protein n=1 Tax=Gracilimonas sediminicola TaxID=2952158 RepID=A0A9X2L478_9BACT|nr:hypothetical protein [Gracilimonas sediminicola]MCP9291949.1 hypothetical protein [Gracilimonas sediminicola]